MDLSFPTTMTGSDSKEIEYSTVTEVSGPLMVVEGVTPAPVDKTNLGIDQALPVVVE